MNNNIAGPKVSTTFQTDSSLKQNSHRSLLPLVRKCEIFSFRCTSIIISTHLLSVSQSISLSVVSHLVWFGSFVYSCLLGLMCLMHILDLVDNRVGQSVESALIALAAILLAHRAYLNNFPQKILYFDASRQKRVLFNCFATKQCLGMLKM